MTQRIGICDDCSARYKIPETVTATKAKCKKCGGVVQIPAPEAGKDTSRSAGRTTGKRAPTKPTAPPSAKRSSAKSSRPRPTRVNKSSADKPPAAAGRGRRRRGRGAKEEAETSSTASGRRRGSRSSSRESKGGLSPLLIAAGVFILIGAGGLAWFMMSSEDESPETEDVAKAATDDQNGKDQGAADDTAAEDASATTEDLAQAPVPDDTGAAGQDSNSLGGDDPTAADDSAAKAQQEPPPEEEVVVNTLIEFEPLTKNHDTPEEDWQQIQDHIDGMAEGGRARKRHLEKLKPYGLDALPALINTFNGIDLTDSFAWSDAFEVALFIQEELVYGLIKVPFKGDFSEDPQIINYNYKAVHSLVDYWRKRQENPELLAASREKFQENKAAMESN